MKFNFIYVLDWAYQANHSAAAASLVFSTKHKRATLAITTDTLHSWHQFNNSRQTAPYPWELRVV